MSTKKSLVAASDIFTPPSTRGVPKKIIRSGRGDIGGKLGGNRFDPPATCSHVCVASNIGEGM